jgi:hypothetical protein
MLEESHVRVRTGSPFASIGDSDGVLQYSCPVSLCFLIWDWPVALRGLRGPAER